MQNQILCFIVADNFLEKPTAFGVPLGALLLFFWVMRAIQDNKSTGQQSTRQITQSGFAPSTESITSYVNNSVVTFSSSAMKAAGGRTVFSSQSSSTNRVPFLSGQDSYSGACPGSITV